MVFILPESVKDFRVVLPGIQSIPFAVIWRVGLGVVGILIRVVGIEGFLLVVI